MQMPVATFQSGPVNSLRGAALLASCTDAAVVDIGGTTTDAGLLVKGLPRPAARAVRLAGAPTNFQMPDLLSIGLGGGSIVRFTSMKSQPSEGGEHVEHNAVDLSVPTARDGGTSDAEAAQQHQPGAVCTVGPDSVGARLAQAALCMGGDVCTATDVAVVLGKLELGVAEAAAARLSKGQAEVAWRAIQNKLEACLDAVKTEAGGLSVSRFPQQALGVLETSAHAFEA
jgi:N-methylhydantoinase A/oxoprolinase/acetone carboxylase beta subunit